MLNIKKIIKTILCPIQCMRFGIKNRRGKLYIGKGCKIVNASRIDFEKNVSIMPYNMIVCHEGGRIHFGENVEIGMYSRITAQEKVEIGKNVFSGPHIFIADYNHEYRNIDIPINKQGRLVKKNTEIDEGGVLIGDDTWIGTNVVIVGTVKIGKHCVIGANSVITKDIPDYSVVVGSPSRVIKRYNKETNQWEMV